MPRGAGAGRETSFLSFDDAPNSPHPQAAFDGFGGQSYDSITTPHASTSTNQHPSSPDYSAPASGSNRSSPSKPSRLTRSRPGSSKDLASAAFADPSDASDRAEALHASPPRSNNKPPSSRGTRLGALLGRGMPGNNDGTHSRNTSSSTNHTEPTSSNDSSFFGRRNRSKALPQQADIDEMPDTTLTNPTVASTSNAARSASAMGMLDFKPESPRVDSNIAAEDARMGNGKPARPSSQSNLLDSITGGAQPSTSSTAAPQQSRGGRLGRLAYKKEDSIAFIAQSRNASQQMTAAAVRNSSLQDAERQQQQQQQQHQWSATSNASTYATTRGLGIEHVNDLASNDPRGYTHASSYRNTPDYNNGIDHTDAQDARVGVASTSAHTQSVASSSTTSSRAPSVAGTHAAVGYHNRFSRQNLSQQLTHDSSADSAEARAAPSSTEPQAAVTRTSFEKSSDSPRGTLSDAAIAALGAMSGASAGSLLNANGAPLSSKNILTIALQKAQNAVQLDSANNVTEAIAAYKQAVRLLEEVMERIAPRNGKRSRPSREEERRRLRVIHDTYADRIRLLSMIYSPEELDATDETTDTSFSSNAQPAITKADWLDRMRDDSQHQSLAAIPRMDGAEQLEPCGEMSPREDATSFLSITPVRTAFAGSSPSTVTQKDGGKGSPASNQHSWPRSPPVQNEALSPSIDTWPSRRRDHGGPNSRGSCGSRASISLSIADEQEAQDWKIPPPAAIAEEMPSISIEALSPDPNVSASPKKEAIRNAASQIRQEEMQATQHGRSDSDSSYQSTTTGSRLKPTTAAVGVQHRGAFGLDDEVRTPVTPYFDATGEPAIPAAEERASGGVEELQARTRDLSLTLTAKPRLEAVSATVTVVEKPVKMGLAQRARALSFKGPLLRQKASMPSLGGAKKEEPTPMPQASRPGSADLPLTTEPSASGRGEADRPTLWDLQPLSTSNTNGASNLTIRPNPNSNRPRASTASALVSASTATGTISQRRKVSNAAVLARVGDEPEAGVDVEGTGAGGMSRQRSTSQPAGLRRPSIPVAFVTANASTSNGTLPSVLGGGSGEGLPPPVPDLARTLSALELKRNPVETTKSTGEGHSETGLALAMPLPRTIAPTGIEVEKGEVARFLITDIFPSGLPSLAAGAPSYSTLTHTTFTSFSSSSSNIPVPAHALLKPFTLLSSIQTSISSSGNGAWFTPHLFIPSNIWRAATGLKLVSVETKLRTLDTLSTALEGVERSGIPLLMPLGSGVGLETSSGSRFVKVLEEFEFTLIQVQNSLSRKLTFIEAVVEGGVEEKKIASRFGSRFTRGLDRMTGGSGGQAKVLDSNTLHLYVEALSRVCGKAQVIGSHLKALLVAEGTISPLSSSFSNGAIGTSGTTGTGALQSPGIGSPNPHLTAYSALPKNIRASIMAKLKKASEFHTKVVLAFILHDLGLMLERVNRKGSGLFSD